MISPKNSSRVWRSQEGHPESVLSKSTGKKAGPSGMICKFGVLLDNAIRDCTFS